MNTIWPGVGWAGLVGWLLLRVVRQGQAWDRQALPTERAKAEMPSVHVIVPARNEAMNIADCLASLDRRDDPAGCVRITVVDDGSTDETAACVRTSGQAALLTAGALPPGWLGKPHACWRGAMEADTEWLCFIDADVRAAPALLASAVARAEADGLALLSVQPFQDLGSFWERLVIPAGMLMIACASPRQAAGITVNGQFLLVRASAYRQVGGHAAVRGEVCEDNALARLLQAGGFRVAVAAGEHLARVRMYCGLASLWEGFAKNAVDIIGSDRGTAAAAGAGVLVAWGVPLVPVCLALGRSTGTASTAGLMLACVASCVALGVQAATLRHFRTSLLLLPLLPVGVTVAAAIAAQSIRLRRAGEVRWKGRNYQMPGWR